jgi:pyridinium-3,5-bisthiocarboxylic acid mononucleotide nickel chelatase
MDILYFDCFSGVSGDMLIGALLDLGIDFDFLKKELKKIDLAGYQVFLDKKVQQGILSSNFRCEVSEQPRHRSFCDIRDMIKISQLKKCVQDRAIVIFKIVAEAEAKVHGKSVEEVHFHEVGAIDSIIDIVGAAILLDCLDVKYVVSSPLVLGSGTVQCAHGVLPVPAPATALILEGVPCFAGNVKGELTTPTGAAILKSVCNDFKYIPEMKIKKVGYGAGDMVLDSPNILRVFLGEMTAIKSADVWVIETNLDDEKGNVLGFLSELLFAKGALDVFFEAIFMKKNRPAFKISIICEQAHKAELANVVLQHTTSFGVRMYACERMVLARELVDVKMDDGQVVRVKAGYQDGKILKLVPEYVDCVEYAKKMNLALGEVFSLVLCKAREVLL